MVDSEQKEFLDEKAREEGEERKLEWWDSDKLDAVGWGLAFIWGGLVLLLNDSDIAKSYPWWDSWAVFFSGAGTITITIAIIRFLTRKNQGKTIAGLIFGLILLGIGLGKALSWLWPIFLFIIGIFIIRGVIIKKQGR